MTRVFQQSLDRYPSWKNVAYRQKQAPYPSRCHAGHDEVLATGGPYSHVFKRFAALSPSIADGSGEPPQLPSPQCSPPRRVNVTDASGQVHAIRCAPLIPSALDSMQTSTSAFTVSSRRDMTRSRNRSLAYCSIFPPYPPSIVCQRYESLVAFESRGRQPWC